MDPVTQAAPQTPDFKICSPDEIERWMETISPGLASFLEAMESVEDWTVDMGSEELASAVPLLGAALSDPDARTRIIQNKANIHDLVMILAYLPARPSLRLIGLLESHSRGVCLSFGRLSGLPPGAPELRVIKDRMETLSMFHLHGRLFDKGRINRIATILSSGEKEN